MDALTSEPIAFDAFLEDYHAGVASRQFATDVEKAWDDLTCAWESATEEQQQQIRQFWETYRLELVKPTNKSHLQQLKKITKVILNFVGLAAPEFLIDVDGLPIRI